MKNWNPHNIIDSQSGEVLSYIDNFTNFKLSFYKNLLERFEKSENTISIIIQGPLNNRSINTIPDYLKYGEVIVSCWNNDEISRLNKYKNKIQIVVNNYHDVINKARNTNQKNPLILQNYTTLKGIEQATGYFVIKTRSDESYPNLEPLLRLLKKNRDTKNPETGRYNCHKIVTSNIYFRYDKQCKFHPSDHLIAGKRNRMLEVFKNSFSRCCLGQIHGLDPEQVIGQSVIETYFDPILKYRERPNPHRSVEQMKKHFDIIRIRDLPRCTWTSSYRKYDSLTEEEDWCHHINELNKYS
jgi:hypothetical protein